MPLGIKIILGLSVLGILLTPTAFLLPEIPGWELALYVLLFPISIIVVYGLWSRRPWAWYGLLAVNFVGLLLGIVQLGRDPLSGILTAAISVAILAYLFNPGARGWLAVKLT